MPLSRKERKKGIKCSQCNGTGWVHAPQVHNAQVRKGPANIKHRRCPNCGGNGYINR